MKHITEENKSPCNHIESSIEEFYILKDFLKLYGVEARYDKDLWKNLYMANKKWL